ncbi:MAG: hypothetical protein IJZ79_02590 [Bacilli bacterium]|nr:hypothetical protein [Bacilli bacterium]MBQ8218614.1 hypothetical protein [Bacilli bacterium]
MKKKLFKMLLATSLCVLMIGTTGCGLLNNDSSKDNDTEVEQSDDREEKENEKNENETGYDSSEDVINAFWKSMEDQDRDLMASCFYEKANTADEAIDANMTAAETTGDYTVYDLDNVSIEVNNEDAESVVEELNYEDYDEVEHFTVTVPMSQTIENVRYEVNDIYDVVTICIEDRWYLVRLNEIDVVITSQTDLSEEDAVENEKENSEIVKPEANDAEDESDDTTVDNTVTPSEGFSNVYADKDFRAFKVNDVMYTLGESTLQDMIDNNVVFEDTSNANNNIKPNYESETFTILLNEEEYHYCRVSVSNFTEDNKTIAECPITSIIFYDVNDVSDFVENTIEFAFPLNVTEEDLRANSGEPTDYYEYISEDSTYVSHELDYQWEGTKYIGSSGYTFDFVNGVLDEIVITYEP